MTQDIIEMAKKVCDFSVDSRGRVDFSFDEYGIEAFAKLVAADAAAKEREKWEGQTEVEIHEAVLEEREACAMICDKASAASLPAFLAIQIRARGQV